ncbi:Phototropin-2 [Dactylella cylindrospora]|nr:Phototropin-2 [Dactylella cylindrospora]
MTSTTTTSPPLPLTGNFLPVASTHILQSQNQSNSTSGSSHINSNSGFLSNNPEIPKSVGSNNTNILSQAVASNTSHPTNFFMSNPLVLSPAVTSAALRDLHLTDPNSGNNSPAASSDTYFDEDEMEIEMTLEDSFGRNKMDPTPPTTHTANYTSESHKIRPKKEYRTSGTEFYALKVLKKKDVVKLKQVEHVLNERMLLSVSRPQPFIVDLFASWSDRENLYMLLEYSPGGEVFTYLRKMRRFNQVQTQFYIASVTLILEFLHDRGIVYRDLKPENILLDARGHVKLVDFGFAKQIGSQETYTLCGTPEYLSPEVIQSRGHTTAVDWWALGILTYEFLCGFPPFYDNSPFAIYEKIVQGRISFPAALDETTRDFISRLCEADLSSRLGNLKNGARDVKDHSFFFGIDWKALGEQRMNGPLVPELSFPGDTRYFDEYPHPSPDLEPYRPQDHPQEENFFKDF